MVPVDYLKECFQYKDGKLYWKERPIQHFASKKSWLTWTARFACKEAGSVNSSNELEAYLRVGIRYNGKSNLHLVHRVIWAILNDAHTDLFIDHIDGNPQNNKIENLRAVSNQENLKNARMWSHNTSGLTGVSWDTRWKLWRISGGGTTPTKRNYLGISKSLFEAACLRKAWEISNKYSERHGK